MPAARRSIAVAVLGAVVAVVAPRPAHADRVDELTALLAEKPADMSASTWREQRREAARELGRIGDRRAVPALIELVRTEKFDVAAEYAIESLGEIGDDRAVPVLREVVGDSSRDRLIRRAARRALEEIGADPAPAGDAAGGVTGDAGALLRDADPGSVPEGPEFAPDTIAASERLTIAAGDVRLEYDTVRDRSHVDGDASAVYERAVDREQLAYRYRVGADLAAAVADYDEDDSDERTLVTDVAGSAQARLYADPSTWFGMVRGDAALLAGATKIDRAGDDDTRELRWGADLHATLAGGYGRVVDVGAALRLERIELVLERARALGRPIGEDVAARVQRAWWALRGERGAHEHLVATVAILREAGVLLGEPDASLTYQILQVLTDGQLVHRLEGYEAHVGVTESLIARDDEIPAEEGRVETVVGRAVYARQSEDGTRELTGDAVARYRILAGDDATPWLLRARAAHRSYQYDDTFDPVGALEFAAEAGLAQGGIGDPDDDPGDATNTASRLAGRVGWIWFPNRASRFKLSGEVALESGEMFVGVTLDVVYGLLDATFSPTLAAP